MAVRQLGHGITLGTVPFTNGTGRGGCKGQSPNPTLGAFVADVPCGLEIFISRRPGRTQFSAPAPSLMGMTDIGGAASQSLRMFDADRWVLMILLGIKC